MLVPHPEIGSGCITWGGVQQALLEVLGVPEACWQVSGRKGVGMDAEAPVESLEQWGQELKGRTRARTLEAGVGKSLGQEHGTDHDIWPGTGVQDVLP